MAKVDPNVFLEAPCARTVDLLLGGKGNMKIITKGLHGKAMPRIIKDFNAAVVGKKIVKIGYTKLDGRLFPVLELDDGSYILAEHDDERNGPGVFGWYGANDKTASLCQISLEYS